MQFSRATAAAVLISGMLLCRTAEARQPDSVENSPPPLSAEELSPDSPLAPMPELEVAWPEIEDAAPISGEVSAAGEIGDEIERRYTVRIEGLDSLPKNEIENQFQNLSALKRESAKDPDANAAQVDRRAREDVQLLEDLLRAHGYYEARIDRLITAAPDDKDRLLVTLTVDPGRLFTYSQVNITGVEERSYDKVRALLKLQSGDPVDATKTEAAELGLQVGLPRSGYAFSTIGNADIVIDHDSNTGSFEIPVDTGPLTRFGEIHVQGDRIFGPKHVSRIARFDKGDIYDVTDIEDLRRAIIATGLVSDVEIKPVRGAMQADGTVLADLDVRMSAAPMRTIAGSAGYDTGQGVRAEISWQHRNLIRPEGAVTFRGVAGTKEQLVAAELRRSNFKRRDQVLASRVAVQRQRLDAYDAETVSLGAGIERQTNLIWQKKWTWAFGGEIIGSREEDNFNRSARPITRTFFIAAAPTRLAYDGSDDLLDPHRGFRLSARVSPELSLQSGQTGYVRTQIDGSAYMPLGSDNYILAGRFRFGQISGASNFSIAPSRRFYVGGGGSVRGYGYQRIGPRDINNDPIGGRSLTELAVEARIRFGNFGVVPFFDAGQLYTSALPKFTQMRYGAGLGLRYYSSFGPIRVDVGTPINPDKGDSRIAIYVSLGQAF